MGASGEPVETPPIPLWVFDGVVSCENDRAGTPATEVATSVKASQQLLTVLASPFPLAAVD
jgi:hypothetical protein